MVDATGTSLFTYDLANRLVGAVDANKQMVSYQYNANGQPTRVLLPDGRSVERTYSSLGKVEHLKDGDGATTVFFYQTGTGGQMSGTQLPTNVPVIFSPLYNTLGLLEQVEEAGQALFMETYTPVDTAYPTASPLNVVSTIDSDDYTDTLTARTDMRLLTEVHDSDVPTNYWDKTYGYDPTGNLTSQLNELTTPDTIVTEFYNRANFLTGFQTDEVPVNPATFAANPHNVLTDRNGNIKRIVKNLDFTESPDTFTWDFSFDPENRLIEARGFNTDTQESTILEFGYDGLGRRVITRENGVGHWYVYDGDQLVQDRGERTDELLVEYTYGPTPTGPAAIFKQNRGGQERFFYTSPQGGFPRYAFDDTGALTDWLQYSAFGELVFHEASGTPTEIEVGWKGMWNWAVQTPLPFAQFQDSEHFRIPSLDSEMNRIPMDLQLQALVLWGGATPSSLPPEASWKFDPDAPPTPKELDPGLTPTLAPVVPIVVGVLAVGLTAYAIYLAASLSSQKPLGCQTMITGLSALKDCLVWVTCNCWEQGKPHNQQTPGRVTVGCSGYTHNVTVFACFRSGPYKCDSRKPIIPCGRDVTTEVCKVSTCTNRDACREDCPEQGFDIDCNNQSQFQDYLLNPVIGIPHGEYIPKSDASKIKCQC